MRQVEYLFDALGCTPPEALDEGVEGCLDRLVHELDLHVRERMVVRFLPQGTTVCYVLEESHLVAHTYPEHSLLTLNLYKCSGGLLPTQLLRVVEVLREMFHPSTVRWHRVDRGGAAGKGGGEYDRQEEVVERCQDPALSK